MNRYVPLDVFRGLTVAFMILVNTPGSWLYVYPPLRHAVWHGFTPTDLVFPSFLFAVGNAMAFVSRKWVSTPAKSVLAKGFKRGLLIFAIGYVLSWFPFFAPTDTGFWAFEAISDTRIFGVLQRIGVCYVLALVLVYALPLRKLLYVSAFMLLGYWALLVFAGDLSLDGNIVQKFDVWAMGSAHLYKGEGIPFDPEGILSSIPAVVSIIIGYLVGLKFREKQVDTKTVLQVLVWGVALLFAGFFWNYVFPINKKIWTSSYVLLTSGLSIMVLSLIIYIMDFSQKMCRLEAFNTMGKNPLSLYVISIILAKLLDISGLQNWIYENGFRHVISPEFGSLLFAIVFTALFWAMAVFLDKRKIYIKI